MWKNIVLLMLFSQVISRILDENLKPLQELVRSISRELNPYQIVLLVNVSDLETSETEYVKKHLLQDFPTVLVDFQNVSILPKTLDYSSFGSPRYTTLFVLLRSSNLSNNYFNFTATIDVLDSYEKMFSRPIRPRWLTIVSRGHAKIDDEINALLKSAWKKKFLDFTILEVTSALRRPHAPTLHRYNPFLDSYEATAYHANKTLFPDKTRDMNGHPLKTIFLYEPPFLYLTRDATGHVTSINGSDYWFILTASQALNFRIASAPNLLDNYGGTYNRTTAIGAISNDELDLAGNQLQLLLTGSLERSAVVKFDEHCALVPINPHRPSLLFSPKFYSEISAALLYILGLTAASRLAGFDRRVWSWTNVLRLILSVSVSGQPRRARERILFGSVVVTSIYYSSVYYARVANDSLGAANEAPFRSYRDLYRSGLTPLVYAPFLEANFNISNKYVQRLKARAEVRWNMNLCAEEIARRHSVACIMSESLGRVMAKKYVAHDGAPTMRVMRPCFWLSCRSFAFAPGFPYAEKFDQLFQRIVESGLTKRWREITKQQITPLPKAVDEVDRTKQRIGFVLCAGHSIALLVFFVELLVNYINGSL